MPGKKVHHPKGFASTKQQGWAFATDQPFAKTWAKRTEKQAGGFSALPKKAGGKKKGS